MQIKIPEIMNLPLFRGISEADLKPMLACVCPEIRKYCRGETVVPANGPLKGVGVLLSGEAEVKRESASGARSIIGFVEKGGVFGEMSAFSGGRVWPATVTAKTGCTVMFIPTSRFLGNCGRSCAAHKALIQNMLRILSEKAVSLSRKVEYLSIKSMRGKICAYLLEQSDLIGGPAFILPMNRNDLADYLGVSRPSMSREMGRLRDEGVIDFYMSGVRILDMDRIKKFALKAP